MLAPKRIRVLVEKEYQRWLKGPQMAGWLEVAERCVLKEQARMRRILVKHRASIGLGDSPFESPFERGQIRACHDLIAKLKGKR